MTAPNTRNHDSILLVTDQTKDENNASKNPDSSYVGTPSPSCTLGNADETVTVTTDLGEILRGLKVLVPPGSVTELRVLNTKQGTISGYYDDLIKLAASSAAWSGKAEGVYFTLNSVKPDLLARAHNRAIAWAKHTTKDTEIARRGWLPIDFDPVRPAGISSTDEEHEAALQRARDCRDFLRSRGWPEPVFADSGNGAHLLYRIDLPNDSDSSDLVKQSLEALDFRFTDSTVKVDLKTFNASRIWKLYGTIAAKGDNMPERPHRRAALIDVPDPVEVVFRDVLTQLAATIPSRLRAGASHDDATFNGKFDLEVWIDRHGLPIAGQKPWNGGQLWVLSGCPWNPVEHKDRAAFIAQFSNGAVAAGCHHDACKGNDWKTLRRLLDGDKGANENCAPQTDHKQTDSTAQPEILEMPLGVEVGLIKEFLDIYTPTTECPREFLWSSLVTCFGLALSPYVARKNVGETQPRWYACNIGQSGIPRKSTGAKLAINTFKQAINDSSVRMVLGFGSSEGLLRLLQNAQGIPVLNYLDELEMLFKKTTVTGSAGITPLHVLYEGNSYEHPLMQGGVAVNDAHLAVLANSTTERFVDLWQAENIDSGFLSRWTLVAGAPTKRLSDPPAPDPQRLAGFCEKLRKLVEEVRARAGNSKILIGFATDKARDIWNTYYVSEINPAIPVYNRIDTIGERLMMILAIAQNRFEIDADTVRTVIQFLRYQVAVRRILCPRVANNPVASLQQRILARFAEPGQFIKRRNLYRSIHADREGTDNFKKAIDGLVEEGFLQEKDKGYLRLE